MDSNQIIKAIPVDTVFTFWITLNCFYIGHCLRNVFRPGSYFFNVIEKIDLKNFFEEKESLALQDYRTNPYEWLNM